MKAPTKGTYKSMPKIYIIRYLY